MCVNRIFASPEQGFTPTNLADLPTMSLDYQNLMHTRWPIMTTNKMDAYKMANEVTHQKIATKTSVTEMFYKAER